MTREEFEKLTDEEMNAALMALLYQLSLVKEEEAQHIKTA